MQACSIVIQTPAIPVSTQSYTEMVYRSVKYFSGFEAREPQSSIMILVSLVWKKKVYAVNSQD